MIQIFNVVLISDKDENTIINGKHILFQLSTCSYKLYGSIFYVMQIEMSHFIQAPASLVFATISEFWFLGFAVKIFWGSKNKILQFCTIIHLNIGDINRHWPTFSISKYKIYF